jgi:signal transduction histidine kinase
LEAPLENAEDERLLEDLLLDADDRGRLEFELPQRRKDGTTFAARVYFYARETDSDGVRPGSIVLVQDLEEVGRSHRWKKDFLSIVSHELRTPLTSIKGAVSVLDEGAFGSLNEDQHTFLDIIERNADRLMELISGLVDTSRLEAGHLQLEIGIVNLSKILREVESQKLSEFKDKDISLVHEEEGDLTRVLADSGRIEQVCSALLENAMKFSQPGGSVVVRAMASDRAIQVTFTDEGIGIQAEQQAKVFDKFFQIDSSATRINGGMGLGLYVARRIIELHQGRIWLESEPGKGTSVHFSLPNMQGPE